MGNTMRTWALMALLSVILVLIGGLFGRGGMIFAFIFAFLMNFFAYWFSDKLVLAMYRAKKVEENETPQLHRIVKELAQKANLPMPKVYIIPSQTPNAFATGRNPEHAALAVTSGIMETFSENELRGVLSHELSHVRHRDILIGTVAATIAGAITLLARMAQWVAFFGGVGGGRNRREGGNIIGIVAILVMAILAPIAALLIQMAISRSREYLADEGGARLSGNPLFLAEALRKLAAGVRRKPMPFANPATTHLFIVNPLRPSRLMALFSTHPPIEERINRLEKIVMQ